MSEETYRILIPSEYLALRESIGKGRLRIVVDTLLNTGMRYSELQRFADNLGWFDKANRAISLPAKATKTQKKRVIHITPQFATDLALHLGEHKKLQVPGIRSMEGNLQSWWLKHTKKLYSLSGLVQDMTVKDLSYYPKPKTFRKTWESWLLAVYPDKSMNIALSQGHSALIAYGHYMNLDPRLKSEMDLVRKLTEGWGT